MNLRSRRKSRLAVVFCLTAFAAIALSITLKAHAQFMGKSAATMQFESNSNVFNLNTGVPLPTGSDSRRGDTFLGYGARFDLEYQLGRQQFFASAGTTEFNYQRHTDLNHNDYRLEAGLKWKLAELLDGKVDVTRTHSMVPFYDLSGTALSLETQQREEAVIGLKVTPEWRVEGDAYTSKLDEPIRESPNLTLTENSGRVTLNYSGLSRFTGGIYAGYLSGSYGGTNANGIYVNGINFVANPDYRQYAGGFATTYKSPRATLEGQLGYTKRTSATGSDDTSGVTGLFSLKEQLTYKTNIRFEVSRAIQSYLLNSGSEIDSTIGVTAEWQATHKLAVTLGYTYTYRDYPGQGNDPVGSERVDIQSAAHLTLDYRPQRWISIRPYANLLWRISNFIGGEFNSNIFGLYVTLLTPDK